MLALLDLAAIQYPRVACAKGRCSAAVPVFAGML
jgi:hypothetical protein